MKKILTFIFAMTFFILAAPAQSDAFPGHEALNREVICAIWGFGETDGGKNGFFASLKAEKSLRKVTVNGIRYWVPTNSEIKSERINVNNKFFDVIYAVEPVIKPSWAETPDWKEVLGHYARMLDWMTHLQLYYYVSKAMDVTLLSLEINGGMQ